MSKAGIAFLKLMLSTGEYADVHFLVGDGDGKKLLSAHKPILKLASDVFEAMFRFDANKEQTENGYANCPVVEVPDVEAAAFKVMLSFIYTEDLSELNGDNTMAVLYAAKKYNIHGLVHPSLQIPISKLRNVFFAYAQARLFDLEDFANRYLRYIDKNADILLKSDAFLQIDQKLLCEIFERDELQIQEEISIWDACRENGIECSAENRRKMLGPALFKIRFPLFSQKEFSDKIVPSGILTTIEVIGVEHYHINPNFCGISDGLLYPVQFPSHQRIWTFGKLLMDIEKVSESVEEMAWSNRYSKTLYINGLPWRIWAQIKTKMGSTDNKKYLGFYLLCDAPIEDSIWRCRVHSATFRIVSQKKGAHNSTGTFTDRVFNNKKNWLGLPNFISFAELMDPSNGFYNREEDRVTLAIDVIGVKDEKMQKFVSEPNKSEWTFCLEIEKMSEFMRELNGSERKSETVTYIKGLPRKVLAQIRKTEGTYNEKCLGIFLSCAASKEENWSCECSAIIRIVSQKSDVADFRKEFDAHVINNEFNDWGFPNFITFAKLMDLEEALFNKSEDKVTFAIDVKVKEAKTEHKT
ncbi:hypothetical protein niasHT_028414 [Heterodera trifolii]|uniref:BTB domain-containing protein n=1 Tax=Heterodera trifolii TaxID=157864 RepID=A0ABD2JIU4_9BILA